MQPGGKLSRPSGHADHPVPGRWRRRYNLTGNYPETVVLDLVKPLFARVRFL
jgi:hypothetical protein